MATSSVPGFVLPLGIFGVSAGQSAFSRVRDQVKALQGAIPSRDRQRIAEYLRSGTMIFAIMGYSKDVLNGSFDVAGGESVMTDGRYYWRLDAADYVEHYGTGLPEDFLEWGDGLGWAPPAVTSDQALTVDRYLMRHIRNWDSPL